MHKHLLRLFLLTGLMVAFFLSDQAHAATEEVYGSATVAPYFFIEGADSGVDSLPLKQTTANIRLNGYLASVHLFQIYRNEGNRPIHATYIFPGSTRAAVNGMTMTIGDRRIQARIAEKEEARQAFENAKQSGKSTSLLSQKRPNVFSMEVANIMPGDEVMVELIYSETVTAEKSIYEFVLPGVVGPRYGGDAAHASGETQWIQNPYLAEGSQDPVIYEIDIEMTAPLPIASLESPSHALQTTWHDKHSVQISLQEGQDAGNRDFILRYRLQDERIMTGLTSFEAADENYFMLVSEPPDRITPAQIPARDYFFIIDVSGSMEGFPLETAGWLISNLLHDLKPADRFNLLFFAGGSELLSPQPLPATAVNIARAEAMLARQRGGGGTELYPALQRAFAMQSDENSSRNMVLITDGYISAEDRVFRLVDENLQRNNLFAFGIGTAVNRHLIEGIARAGRAEAFIVTSRKEAARQARLFREYVSSPLLTNIQLQAEGVELYDMEPAGIPDLLAQRPILVIGKYRHLTDDGRIVLSGSNGEGVQQWSFRLHEANGGDATLPQLWARKRLERLYVIPETNEDKQRASILELGLRYSLLTRHTSFVAVDDTPRNTTGEAVDVKQPLPLPQGVSNLAIGRPMPEPELFWILLLLLLLGFFRHTRGRHHALRH